MQTEMRDNKETFDVLTSRIIDAHDGVLPGRLTSASRQQPSHGSLGPDLGKMQSKYRVTHQVVP